MKAALRLECINDNWGLPAKMLLWVPLLNGGKRPTPRQWVAEITGTSAQWSYTRRFLPHKKDYRQANSMGTRGVYAHYILDEDTLYEVSDPKTWHHTDRYFCIVYEGKIVKLTEKEAQWWLSTYSGSTSTPQPVNE